MNKDLLYTECNFKAVRSSGPGGQHVNKTSTKVVLSWSLELTTAFDEIQKERLEKYLATKLTKDRMIVLSYDQSRSQHKNKETVFTNFIKLLEKGLRVPKYRKKTKPTFASKRKRLDGKKRTSEKKNNRRPPKL